MMEIYSKTDIGKVRTSNQDAVMVKKVSENFVWTLVCDGMGGTNGGDIASRMAVKVIENYLNSSLSENDSSEDIKSKMYEAVNNANSMIFEKSKMDESLSRMGTTVVLCIAKGDTLQIVYAGDSRAYLIRDKDIVQLTKDHSVVQQMVDSGEITEQDAKNHPQKNIITRALGVNSSIDLDYIMCEIEKDDIVLSCTDGLTNHLDKNRIYKTCTENSISFVPSILVNEANICGGNDNITAAIVKI